MQILRWIDHNMQLLFECALEVVASGAPQLKQPKEIGEGKGEEKPIPPPSAHSNADETLPWTAEQQKAFEQVVNPLVAASARVSM